MDIRNHVTCPRSLEWMPDLLYPRIPWPRPAPGITEREGHPAPSIPSDQSSYPAAVTEMNGIDSEGNRYIVTSSWERFGIRFSIPGPNQATFLFCLSQRCFTRWPTRTRTDSQEFYLTLPFRQGSIWFAAFIGLFLSKKKDNILSRCQYPTWEGTIPDRIAYCPKCSFPATQPSIILEYEVANQLKRTQAQISIWELLMTSPALQHRGL